MPDYSVEFTRSARKELERLDAGTAERVFSRIEALATHPRPAGCKKLRGATDIWRIRVGEYRVIYRIDDAGRLVDVRAIRHRRDAYE